MTKQIEIKTYLFLNLKYFLGFDGSKQSITDAIIEIDNCEIKIDEAAVGGPCAIILFTSTLNINLIQP